MFKVSRRADYATRILLTLAAAPPGQAVSAAELSRQTDVPQTYLHKLVQDLARAGLVRTVAGQGGGAILVRPAETLSLLDIFEAMEGPLTVNVCLFGPGACPRDSTCPVHPVWVQVQEQVRQILDSTRLSALVAEGQNLKRAAAWPVNISSS